MMSGGCQHEEVKCVDFGITPPWIQVLALSVLSSEAFGYLLNFILPGKSGDNHGTYLIGH